MSGADIEEIFRRVKSIIADRFISGDQNLDVSLEDIRTILSEMKGNRKTLEF